MLCALLVGRGALGSLTVLAPTHREFEHTNALFGFRTSTIGTHVDGDTYYVGRGCATADDGGMPRGEGEVSIALAASSSTSSIL